MIDTNKIIANPCTLQTKQFNKINIINNNLATMIKFIENDAPTLSTQLFKQQLGINQYNQIIIGKQADQLAIIYNVKPARLGSKRNGDSIADWAKRILNNYYQWLTKHAKIQQQLSPAKLKSLIKYRPNEVLFTPQAYIDWLIPKINTINFVNISSQYIAKDVQYFINQFCVHLSEYQYIKISNFTTVIDIVTDAIKSAKQKIEISPMFVHLLLEIIDNHNCRLPKLIRTDDDEWIEINYFNLITLCYNAHISNIKLPFNAIEQALENASIMRVLVENSSNMDLINITFVAQNTADINSFFKTVSPEDGLFNNSLEMFLTILKTYQKHFSFLVTQSQKALFLKKIQQLQKVSNHSIFNFSSKAQNMAIQLLTVIVSQIN